MLRKSNLIQSKKLTYRGKKSLSGNISEKKTGNLIAKKNIS
jgi:hypothetical protein